MKLLNLKEAADALGYTVKGLRKIVDRSRRRTLGARMRGPTLTFFQTTKGAAVKFKPEWIEEFIEEHTHAAGKPKTRSRRKREKQEASFGFDPELL